MLFVAPGPKAGLETTGNCDFINEGNCEGTNGDGASLIQTDLAQADAVNLGNSRLPQHPICLQHRLPHAGINLYKFGIGYAPTHFHGFSMF